MARHNHKSLNPTTSFLTATTLIYAIGAGITAAAGTGLALQLILRSGFGYNPLQSSPMGYTGKVVIFRRCLTSVGIGQFARLLLPLGMVAVYQAPSPESNPNSPLPVKAMVGHYPTIESVIGHKFVRQRAITRMCPFAILACLNS